MKLILYSVMCRLFGHQTDRYMIEHSKEKECKRCGKKVWCWDVYTVEDYERDYGVGNDT